MNKKFCIKCSAATIYEDELPNVCVKCGNPFNSSIASSIQIEPIQPRPKKRIIAHQIEEEDEDENYEENYEPRNFDIPALELDGPLPSRDRETLQNLAFDRSPKQKINRPKLKKMSNQQFENTWKSEMEKGNSKEIGAKE